MKVLWCAQHHQGWVESEALRIAESVETCPYGHEYEGQEPSCYVFEAYLRFAPTDAMAVVAMDELSKRIRAEIGNSVAHRGGFRLGHERATATPPATDQEPTNSTPER